MLDPITALGLGANILQLVQFGVQLGSLTREIRARGTASSLVDLRNVVRVSTDEAGAVKLKLQEIEKHQILRQEEKRLLDLVTECDCKGREIITCIDSILETNESTSTWQALRRSTKILFNREKVSELVKGHLQLCNLISMSTISLMKADQEQYSKENNAKLDSIHQDMQSSMEKLTTAVQTLSIDNTRCIAEESALHPPTAAATGLTEQGREIEKIIDRKRRGAAILRMLSFRQMTHRSEDISAACRKTFDWVFRTPSAGSSWADFGKYISQDNANVEGVYLPYWINGKAGSGKSTLMKYIASHYKTKAALKNWAGTDDLQICAYYSWSLGTTLQKSYAGLLRSLLIQVLKTHQELIQDVFPELWRDWKAEDENTEPALVELRTAFGRLVIKCAGLLKMCVFVDGIDEFDGNYRDICLFFRNLCSPCLKVIVSSRPINSCVTVFSGCPTLQLQDLTRNDIKEYVEKNLCEQKQMQELLICSPNASALVHEIREKACGVFLWVRLVVNILLDGLENGDSINDLQQRLRSLPGDLKELYQRMMTKMDPTYQVEAAEIFQILRAWQSSEEKAMLTLWLSFANVSASECLSLGPWFSDRRNTARRLAETTARVRSRCCGLVEIHRSYDQDETDSIFLSRVGYLHRTVAEFLYEEEDIWKGICSKTESTGFDPATNLTYSTLCMLKSMFANGKNLNKGLDDLKTFLRFLTNTRSVPDDTYRKLVDCLDRGLQEIVSRKAVVTRVDHWSSQLSFVDPKMPSGKTPFLLGRLRLVQHSILTFASRAGLWKYLNACVEGGYRELIQTLRSSLLICALQSWADHWRPSLDTRLETMKYLLNSVPGSGNEVEERHLWTDTVAIADQVLQQGRPKECGLLLSIFVFDTEIPARVFKTDSRANPIHTAKRLANIELNECGRNFEDSCGSTSEVHSKLQEIQNLGLTLEKAIKDRKASIPLQLLEQPAEPSNSVPSLHVEKKETNDRSVCFPEPFSVMSGSKRPNGLVDLAEPLPKRLCSRRTD